jgi:leader peptidase (prepilin peptidase)/N-methyltransferase
MITWVAVLVSVIGVVLLSPLLAGWTIGLTTTDRATPRALWWRPRLVSPARLVTVAAVTGALAAGAAGGDPLVAWWLFAIGGAVLCIADSEQHLLPARLLYPLAAAVFVALAVTAMVAGEPDRFLRAVLAAVIVCALWFAVAFIAPSAMGLGDVRVAALTAGLLGWTSWTAVLAGQLAAFGLAVVTAGIPAATRPRERGRGMQVPMGPALILGAILVTWL